MKTRRPVDTNADAERRAARALAVDALAFLAADPERIGRFLALTGIGPGDVRSAAAEPHFLAGVLDHVSGDERLLLEFAAHAEIKPAVVERARMSLEGVWERDVP